MESPRPSGDDQSRLRIPTSTLTRRSLAAGTLGLVAAGLAVPSSTRAPSVALAGSLDRVDDLAIGVAVVAHDIGIAFRLRVVLQPL